MSNTEEKVEGLKPGQFKGALPALTLTGEPRKIIVIFRLPTRSLNNQALELAKIAERKGVDAMLVEAETNLLRLCLDSVDGAPVSYGELRGDGLNRLLEPGQIETLNQALRRMSTASEAEVLWCEASAQAVFDDATKHGVYKRRLKVPKSNKADDKGNFEALSVDILIPNRTMIQRAQEAARQFEERSSLVVAAESELNLLRQCVVAIDGAELKRDAVWSIPLLGDGIDDMLSQREQSCLSRVMNRLLVPEKARVDDFLSSVASE